MIHDPSVHLTAASHCTHIAGHVMNDGGGLCLAWILFRFFFPNHLPEELEPARFYSRQRGIPI